MTTADTLAQWDDQATSAWAQALELIDRQDRLGREEITQEFRRVVAVLNDLRQQIGIEYRDQVRREARAEVANIPVGKALNAADDGDAVRIQCGGGR